MGCLTQVSGEYSAVTLLNATVAERDLKSIYVQYGDGEGFVARVDPSVDALCQPTKQQRIQDLGNSISMKNTQYGFYGNKKTRFLWKQRTSEKSFPQP